MDICSEAIFIHKKKYLDNYIFIFYTKSNGLIDFFINTVYKNKLLNKIGCALDIFGMYQGNGEQTHWVFKRTEQRRVGKDRIYRQNYILIDG